MNAKTKKIPSISVDLDEEVYEKLMEIKSYYGKEFGIEISKAQTIRKLINDFNPDRKNDGHN